MTHGAQINLPADATAPSQARATVRTWLQAQDLTALTDTAVLLTRELVTNAVLHAIASLLSPWRPSRTASASPSATAPRSGRRGVGTARRPPPEAPRSVAARDTTSSVAQHS